MSAESALGWSVLVRWADGRPAVDVLRQSATLLVTTWPALEVVFDGRIFDVPGGDQGAIVREAYRRRTLADLRGRFAFLVVDRDRGLVTAGRDPVGVHPLFHAPTEGGTLFSDDLRTLVRDRSTTVRFSAGAVSSMLTGIGGTAESTVVEGVSRVVAGHHLELAPGRTTQRRVWVPGGERRDPDSADELFAGRLERAVRRGGADRQAISLSGGLDSAAVAAAARKVSDEDGRPKPVAAALLIDETEIPRQHAVAHGLGLDFVTARLDDEGSLVTALRLAGRCGAPPGIATPSYDEVVTNAGALGCRSILTGDGGDEWAMPPASWSLDRLRRGDGRALLGFARALGYGLPGSRLARRVRVVGWDLGIRRVARDASLRAGAALGWRRPAALVRSRQAASFPDWLHPVPADTIATSFPLAGAHRRELLALLGTDFMSLLHEEAYAIQGRTGVTQASPFHDADLIDALLGLPPERLIAAGRSKALTRDYLGVRLRTETRWTSKPFADDLIAGTMRREAGAAWRELEGVAALSATGVVDGERLAAELEGHRPSAVIDHAVLTWEALALESWLRTLTIRFDVQNSRLTRPDARPSSSDGLGTDDAGASRPDP